MRLMRITFVAALLFAACVPQQQETSDAAVQADAQNADAMAAHEQTQTALDQANQAKLVLNETLQIVESALQDMGVQQPQAAALSGDIETGLANAPESQREKIQAMLADLRKRYDALQSRGATAEAKLNEARKKMGTMDDQSRSELQPRLDALQQRLQAALDENAKLQTALAHYETALAEALARIDELEAQQREQQAVINNQTAEIEASKSEAERQRAQALIGSVIIDTIANLRQAKLLRGRRFGPKVGDCSACGCSDLDLGKQLDVTVPAPNALVEVFSLHPVGSYRRVAVSTFQTRIEIQNPEAFWKISRCLVIGYKTH